MHANAKIPGHCQTGVTLIELMIGLAVTAVLLGMAAPAMHGLVGDQRQITRVNTLLGHLQLARSEAIKRGQRTVVCPSINSTSCADSTLWHTGWLVFVDPDGDRERSAEEPLIVVQTAQVPTAHIDSGGRKRIVYQPSGFAGGSTATFTFCDTRGADAARAIIISNTGRARASETLASGAPLSCPAP